MDDTDETQIVRSDSFGTRPRLAVARRADFADKKSMEYTIYNKSV
jgi:hypothetical protein